MIVIGLGYKARSGKDTVADYLVERYKFRKMHLAGPLKRAAQEIFGFTDKQLHSADKEALDLFWEMSPRKTLQLMGTEAIRGTFGNDIWVRVLENRICKNYASALHADNRIVVPDVRFPNEMSGIRQLGQVYKWQVEMIKVTREEHEGLSGKQGTHASEVGFDNMSDDLWDYHLNSKKIAEWKSKLFNQVDEVVGKILQGGINV